MELFKIDLFFDMVYVFMLKGDVIEFLFGFVLIDFFYWIYLEIGNKIIGVKVNGKMVMLDYKFWIGDIVEIFIFKYFYGLSQDWVKFV